MIPRGGIFPCTADPVPPETNALAEKVMRRTQVAGKDVQATQRSKSGGTVWVLLGKVHGGKAHVYIIRKPLELWLGEVYKSTPDYVDQYATRDRWVLDSQGEPIPRTVAAPVSISNGSALPSPMFNSWEHTCYDDEEPYRVIFTRYVEYLPAGNVNRMAFDVLSLDGRTTETFDLQLPDWFDVSVPAALTPVTGFATFVGETRLIVAIFGTKYAVLFDPEAGVTHKLYTPSAYGISGGCVTTLARNTKVGVFLITFTDDSVSSFSFSNEPAVPDRPFAWINDIVLVTGSDPAGAKEEAVVGEDGLMFVKMYTGSNDDYYTLGHMANDGTFTVNTLNAHFPIETNPHAGDPGCDPTFPFVREYTRGSTWFRAFYPGPTEWVMFDQRILKHCDWLGQPIQDSNGVWRVLGRMTTSVETYPGSTYYYIYWHGVEVRSDGTTTINPSTNDVFATWSPLSLGTRGLYRYWCCDDYSVSVLWLSGPSLNAFIHRIDPVRGFTELAVWSSATVSTITSAQCFDTITAIATLHDDIILNIDTKIFSTKGGALDWWQPLIDLGAGNSVAVARHDEEHDLLYITAHNKITPTQLIHYVLDLQTYTYVQLSSISGTQPNQLRMDEVNARSGSLLGAKAVASSSGFLYAYDSF